MKTAQDEITDPVTVNGVANDIKREVATLMSTVGALREAYKASVHMGDYDATVTVRFPSAKTNGMPAVAAIVGLMDLGENPKGLLLFVEEEESYFSLVTIIDNSGEPDPKGAGQALHNNLQKMNDSLSERHPL